MIRWILLYLTLVRKLFIVVGTNADTTCAREAEVTIRYLGSLLDGRDQ